MQKSSSSIIGEIIFQLVLKKFHSLDNLDGKPFLVLKGFEPIQLLSFTEQTTQSSQEESSLLTIQFSKSIFEDSSQIDESFLTTSNGVDVRNRRESGTLTITCDNESETEESLSNNESLSLDELRDDKEFKLWTDALAEEVNVPRGSNVKNELEVLVKAFIGNDHFKLDLMVEYLLEVTKDLHLGETMACAASNHLKVLRLPLHSKCFDSINLEKKTQPGLWKNALSKHEEKRHYIRKKTPKFDPIDTEEFEEKILKIKETLESKGTLDHREVKHFELLFKYCETDSTPKDYSQLFFGYDWSENEKFFLKKTKTTGSRKLVAETVAAIKNHSKEDPEDVILDSEKKILDELEGKKQKAGEAIEEEKAFFEIHKEAIELHSIRILKAWEKYIYGTSLHCTNFIEGIYKCVERLISTKIQNEEVYVEIKAKNQNAKTDFDLKSWHVWEYFERHYANLDAHFSNLVRFSPLKEYRTLLLSFSEWGPSYKEEKKGKRRGRVSRNANTNNKGLEFQISLVSKKGDEIDPSRQYSLVWKFEESSVLKYEKADLQAIVKKAKKESSSATVIGKAAYDSSNKKGLPVSISLSDATGFSDALAEKGRGAFIPRPTSIKTVKELFIETLEKHGLPEKEQESLINIFEDFDADYLTTLEAFTKDALELKYVPKLTASYGTLIEKVSLQKDSLRRSLTKLILRIGSVNITETSQRPPLLIILPWHPLRLEALWGQREQIHGTFKDLIRQDVKQFSDASTGSLYFEDLKKNLESSLFPEIGVLWNQHEAIGAASIESIGGYSLHAPFEKVGDSHLDTKSVQESRDTIMTSLNEYLELQPHEKDNVSLLLFDCQDSKLPQALAAELSKMNSKEVDKKGIEMNCEVFISHRERKKIQDIYKSLIANADENQDTQIDGFLNKIRINLSAAVDITHKPSASNSPPIDIVFAKDLLSSQAEQLAWDSCERTKCTLPADSLVPHRWTRHVPNASGDEKSSILHCCPTQTNLGWIYLKAVTYLLGAQLVDETWNNGKVLRPAKALTYHNNDVQEFLKKAHELGVWVVTEDEMLDRRILEKNSIQIIRYVQNVSQGRNLVVSSKVNDTLLVKSLTAKLNRFFPNDDVTSLKDFFVEQAKEISGGLILRAARQTNNTSELMGVVLSKYIVDSELPANSPVCWCSLDDYSRWLGKTKGQIADLLALAPSYRGEKPHLDIVVTEAKYLSANVSKKEAESKTQLTASIVQIARALSNIKEERPLDQSLWLSRISDILLTRLVRNAHDETFAPEKWRQIVRNCECTFAIRGYSHVFIDEKEILSESRSSGVDTGINIITASQETFCQEDVSKLLRCVENKTPTLIEKLRTNFGSDAFEHITSYTLNTEITKPAPDESNETVSPSAPLEGENPTSADEITFHPKEEQLNVKLKNNEKKVDTSSSHDAGIDPDIMDFLDN